MYFSKFSLRSCAPIVVITSGLFVFGCSSSSTTPITEVETESTSTVDSQLIIDQIANDASLEGSVLQIRDLVFSGTLAAFGGLNRAYSEGTLSTERLDCLDQNAGFPVFEYFCGEDGVGDRLTDFGYSVFALSVFDTTDCRNSVLAGDAPVDCAITFSDAEIAGEWFVKFSSDIVEGVEFDSLTLSNGVVPDFVDIGLTTSVCDVKIIGNNDFEYNDKANCRASVAQVLAILQAP